MTERRMLQEISAWLSFNTSRPSSELQKMKNDIDQLLETASKIDYTKLAKWVHDCVSFGGTVEQVEDYLRKSFA